MNITPSNNSAKILFVKIKDIVGYLYLPSKAKSAIILAQGGPAFGDTGKSLFWPVVQKYNLALFVPDYIGFCRSDGKFNFRNCLLTLNNSEEFLQGHITGTDLRTGKKIKCKFSQISLLGISWGGAMAPFLERYYRSSIKNIILISPMTDWTTQGQIAHSEEYIIQTSKTLKTEWKNVYRGYADSEWPKIIAGKSKECNPLDNIKYLKDKVVFIVHGKDDNVIHWSKSYRYYNALRKAFPKQKIYWNLRKGEHTTEFAAKALDFVLKKLSGIVF